MSVYEKSNIDSTQIKSHALAILVENQVGALARVVSMFSAENILTTLASAPTWFSTRIAKA